MSRMPSKPIVVHAVAVTQRVRRPRWYDPTWPDEVRFVAACECGWSSVQTAEVVANAAAGHHMMALGPRVGSTRRTLFG